MCFNSVAFQNSIYLGMTEKNYHFENQTQKLLFVSFEKFSGQIFQSHINLLENLIQLRVLSISFSDIIDLIIYPSNPSFIKLIKFLLASSNDHIDIGSDFHYQV